MGEKSYTVYEPEAPASDLLRRADKLVFIKDGFSFWAMAVPLLWLIYHRLWLPLVGFIIAMAVVEIFGHLIGIRGEQGLGLIVTGLSVAFGFLANDVRRLVLERRGYQLVGTVVGSSELDCERRFLDDWEPLIARIGRDKGGREALA